MKKLGLPDRADVNPPTPVCSGSEHNCLIFRKKERRQKMPAKSFSCSAFLQGSGSFLAQGIRAPAQTLLGTDWRDEVGHLSLPKGRSLQGMSEQGMGLLGHSRAWTA